MTLRHGALAALLAAGCFLLSTGASAYCRTRSCDVSRETCDYDESFCIASGVPLFWPSSCVSFTVQRDGSLRHEISARRFESAVSDAFATWLAADCGGGATPRLSIESLGQVDCDQAEYNQDQGNANIFMFREDDWPDNNSGHALALTTLWFNPQSGAIYDVDVEVNATGETITVGEVTAGIDLPSILTHEIGHFLGLSHSRHPSAVMRPFYEPRKDNLRVLHADDVAGICSIYTAERATPTDTCTPRHGFQSACGSNVEGGGCALGARTSSPGAPFVLAFAAGALVRWRRRSSRGAARGGPR